MTTEQDHLIDDYLLGRLGPQEVQAFEQQLAQDPALATELAERRQLVQAIQYQGNQDLKARLGSIARQVAQDDEQARPRPHLMRGKPWRIAAATAAAIALCIIVYQLLSGPPNPQALYAAYYQPYALSLGSRGEPVDASLALAASYYQSGKYAAAIPLFEQARASQPTNGMLKMALGLCYLNTGNLPPSRAAFAELIEQKDPYFEDLAHWYTALGYLRGGQPSEALPHLQVLASEPGADQHPQAVELLRELTQ